MGPTHRSPAGSTRALLLFACLLGLVAAGTPVDASGPEPTAAAYSGSVPRDAGSWPILWTEGFEEAFPGPNGQVFDDDGGTGGEYFWGKESCKKHTGEYSAWAVGAGNDGGALVCGGYYPLNTNPRMVYGPFDLSVYADAELEFWFWNYSEHPFDPFTWSASGDGTAWVGGGQHTGVSGGAYTPAWVQQVFDLGAWAGDKSVWIAFEFSSDNEKTHEGPYVDDLVLRALPSATFRSVGTYDGWVRESTETSSVGGALNADAVTCRIGDDGVDRQFRSILDFNTKGLPDDAQILSVVLEIRQAGVVGTTPFLTHHALVADIRTGAFANARALQSDDFQAKATQARAARFGALSPDGRYRATLPGTALPLINTTGRTQFRLRFLTGDNDDLSADYLAFTCGDALAPSRRPVLRVTYLVP